MGKEKNFMNKVLKRDGRIVSFKREKIVDAIQRAGQSTGELTGDDVKLLAHIVITEIIYESGEEPIRIEQIQDKVEEVLMRRGYYKTAKAYILYRENRRQLRAIKNYITPASVEKYLQQGTWEVHENANIGYSVQGLKSFLAGKAEAEYWLSKVYPQKIANLHRNGAVHIHNLSFFGSYCVGWDLEDLIKRGFGGVPGKPYSKPAKHFSSILGQIVNFLFTLQNEVAGAVALNSFDTLLAPFVYYDHLTQKEVKQQIQEFVFNMSQTTRTGGQSPFSNITLDIHPHVLLVNKKVVIGGKEQDKRYGEFQKEIYMINKAFWETMIEGDGNHRVFTFPIPTINFTNDFDWDNPELTPMWEATAKYGIPYGANFINSDLKPEDARSMCCRLKLDVKQLRKKGGGLFGANPLTGSIGVITINMARIGYLSRNEEEFFLSLAEIMDAARDGFEVKRKTIEEFTENGLYPYSRVYLESIKKVTGHYWDNHFSTIGLIGMNEALLNFIGKDIGSEEGIAFTIKTMNFMRNKLEEFQDETGHMYNLEATPAESTSYSLAVKDKEKYPDIIVANEKEVQEGNAEPFYTNSTQLPVNYTDDPFEVAEKQEEIQLLYTGGTVVHFFLGESLNYGEEAKIFFKKILTNYKIPYITITPTFSICPKHGYIKGEWKYCPYCDEELVSIAGRKETKNVESKDIPTFNIDK